MPRIPRMPRMLGELRELRWMRVARRSGGRPVILQWLTTVVRSMCSILLGSLKMECLARSLALVLSCGVGLMGRRWVISWRQWLPTSTLILR